MLKFLFTVLIFSLFISSVQVTAENPPLAFARNCVVAHRGAWKLNKFPENSVAALKHAIELNCTGSEFDVRMTADDSLVINHDAKYSGMDIETNTFAKLSSVKLSNGETLPTLRQFLLAGMENNKGTRLICEIKPSEISAARGKLIAEKVMTVVNSLKAAPEVVFISFDYGILKRIVELDKSANTQYLEGDVAPKQLKQDGIRGADFHYSVFANHPEWISCARKNNIELNAWTVNDASEMDWLLANGFDFITTNEPELLFSRIKETPVTKGWKLAWSDEFSYNGLPDSTKWTYDVGGHGYGNNELQYYTYADTNNALVSDGLLTITARRQPKEGKDYTSARLLTRGKSEFTYGRFETRAKLPAGRGTWPAIWMLGTNIGEAGWPMCGEIDIMEHVGYEKDSIFGTIHSEAYNHMKGTQKGKAIFIKNPYSEFHLYTMEWTPEYIAFMVDNVVYNRIENEHKTVKEWPFDQPFFFIINLAVGGNWGGKYGVDDSIFPVEYQIDYVRVFTN